MRPAVATLTLLFAASAWGQTPPPPAKRLPPAGIAISEADRAELTAGAAALRKEIDALSRDLSLPNGPAYSYVPDIEVFHKAVDWALRYDEFFDPKQVAFARTLLAEGRERAAQALKGKTPWREATGLVIRGYRSTVDGSVQPYALLVPPTWKPHDRIERRLDVVLSGRNEKRTELAFIAEHQKSPGDIVPDNTFVLFPYGRFCNATKFAGEVDVYEAIKAVGGEHRVIGAYPIDADRIVVRGFSMGGASVWHLATHDPGNWVAASPGAGFAETAIYTKALAPGKEPPPWWEQTLWHWYNATDVAGNLFNCPTIAYSGEIDPQKQSADLMEQAMAAEGLRLERLIGPKTGHKYEPATKAELASRLDTLAAAKRPVLPEVKFSTYTLRYNQCDRVEILRLNKSWERADIHLKWEAPGVAKVDTKNVAAFALYFPRLLQRIEVDGETITWSEKDSPVLRRKDGHWAADPSLMGSRSREKEHRLSGPIDDAFMEGFLFVRPTGTPLNEKIGRWAQEELKHATKMWRDIFRGDAPIKNDADVATEDVQDNNLILWGDPQSNQVIAQLADRLPIEWTANKLVFRGHTYDAAHHAPILIFPNPLNPSRYVVLNSGMDFRDDAYGSNALQTPKLPDYAIVDLDVPPGPKWPGKIVDAGFFDEEWK